MTDEHVYAVLFLSQRSAARSVIAAALLNVIGDGRFRAYSAGVWPATQFDPVALELLDHAKVPAPTGAPRHHREFTGEISRRNHEVRQAPRQEGLPIIYRRALDMHPPALEVAD